jgi:hypothetical protein
MILPNGSLLGDNCSWAELCLYACECVQLPIIVAVERATIESRAGLM